MKKTLIIILTIILCLGGHTISAQEVSQLQAAPCWYGEVYSIDCVYTVNGGEIDTVNSMLTNCFFDWNYIEQDDLLLIAAASANPLPDPAQLEAYMSVTASTGTTLTLKSLSINGKKVDISYTVSGTVTSFGDETDAVTIKLLQNSEVKYTVSTVGNTASYSITDVIPGAYIMQVSKEKHIPCEYTILVNGEDVIKNVQIGLFGDVNGDGNVNESDDVILKQYFAGYNVTINTAAADVDADGLPTRRDAMILSRHLAGWDGYTLPYITEDAVE